jgi:hypothetical protein
MHVQTAGLLRLRVCEASPDGLVVCGRVAACMVKASRASITVLEDVCCVRGGA